MARGGVPGARRISIAERRERRAAVEDPAIVLDAAAAFLAVRPRSIGETRRRLQSLGYRAVLIDHVIDRLTAYGYLDDAAFGRAWLESRDRATAARRRTRCGASSWPRASSATSWPRSWRSAMTLRRRDGARPRRAGGGPDLARGGARS